MAKIQLMMEENPIIRKMDTAPETVVFKESHRSASFSRRAPRRSSKITYTTAIPDASVAVKIPERMPPRIRTTMKMAPRDFNVICTISFFV